MKRWLVERFLPMWAKKTVLEDLARAQARVRELEQENRELRAYVRGLRKGAQIASSIAPPGSIASPGGKLSRR